METIRLKECAEVGKTLWIVINGFQGSETIVKIGRKWVHTDRGTRIDLETGEVDSGYTSKGWYPSEQHYLQIVKKNHAWQDLRRAIDDNWSCPNTTLESIQQARVLLSI